MDKSKRKVNIGQRYQPDRYTHTNAYKQTLTKQRFPKEQIVNNCLVWIASITYSCLQLNPQRAVRGQYKQQHYHRKTQLLKYSPARWFSCSLESIQPLIKTCQYVFLTFLFYICNDPSLCLMKGKPGYQDTRQTEKVHTNNTFKGKHGYHDMMFSAIQGAFSSIHFIINGNSKSCGGITSAPELKTVAGNTSAM